MTFLMTGHTACPICKLVIDRRVDAAQLPYAHPNDVGELAAYGRSWVHRRCWMDWPLRRDWAMSATAVLKSGSPAAFCRAVIAMPSLSDFLVTDVQTLISMTVSASTLDELLRALTSAAVSHVQLAHADLDLCPTSTGVHLVSSHRGEIFDDTCIEDPDAWMAVLTALIKKSAHHSVC